MVFLNGILVKLSLVCLRLCLVNLLLLLFLPAWLLTFLIWSFEVVTPHYYSYVFMQAGARSRQKHHIRYPWKTSLLLGIRWLQRIHARTATPMTSNCLQHRQQIARDIHLMLSLLFWSNHIISLKPVKQLREPTGPGCVFSYYCTSSVWNCSYSWVWDEVSKAKSYKDKSVKLQKADNILTSFELSTELVLFQTICDSSLQSPSFIVLTLFTPALSDHHTGVRQLWATLAESCHLFLCCATICPRTG